MSFFSVDTGAFGSALSLLLGAANDLEGVGTTIGSGDPSVGGHPSVVQGISGFQGTWQPGVNLLKGAVAEVSDNLGTTAEVYRTADDSIRSMFSQ